jgi:hypothetical protein
MNLDLESAVVGGRLTRVFVQGVMFLCKPEFPCKALSFAKRK